MRHRTCISRQPSCPLRRSLNREEIYLSAIAPFVMGTMVAERIGLGHWPDLSRGDAPGRLHPTQRNKAVRVSSGGKGYRHDHSMPRSMWKWFLCETLASGPSVTRK